MNKNKLNKKKIKQIIKCPTCGSEFDVTEELNKFKLELIQVTKFMKEVNKIRNKKEKIK